MAKLHPYRPVPFFVLAFAISWLSWFAAAWFSYRSGGEIYQYGFLLIGGFGPLASAVSFFARDKTLAHDFRTRLLDFAKFNPPYLLVTFLLMPVVTWLAVDVSRSFGGPSGQLTLSSDILARVPITLNAPTLEELGWRGYGMDSLRARTGALAASLLFGMLWALWHWPLFLIDGTYQHDLLKNPLYTANFFVSVVPVAVVANWLYYKHRRLILAAILFHFMLDVVPQSLDIGQLSKCIETALFVLIAVAIVVLDRKAFDTKSWTFAEARAA